VNEGHENEKKFRMLDFKSSIKKVEMKRTPLGHFFVSFIELRTRRVGGTPF
jgi:hypothetical protein